MLEITPCSFQIEREWEMSQICSNCGLANSDTAKFCNQCGNALPRSAGQAMPGTGLLPPNAMLSNRYIVLCKVGQGGMGAVYQVADTRIQGKTWAVKEMSDAALTDPLDRQQAIQAFEREAQLLSQLDHPNIPRVIDYFSQGGKQYLAMEFVEGETLEEIMDQRAGPLSEAEVCPWAEQLCEVLDYLHSQQPPVVFRDLKPGNIMIDRAGKVKLIDFGIVRFFQPGKAKDTTSFGTAGYAPPEQYGKGQTDARSDLYALAATLHHLLTARDPSLTPFQFQPVRALNPRVSEMMSKILAKALEQDPARRWQNAKAMKRALSAPTVQPQPVVSQPVAVSAAAYQSPMAAVQAQPSVHQRPVAPPTWGIEMAGIGRRAIAYIVDIFLLYIIQIVLVFPISLLSESGSDDVAAVVSCVALLGSVLLGVWYFVFLQARSGQTPGKKMLGIRVVSADGGQVTKGRYFVRLIGYWISGMLLGIGFLMALWDTNQQALHDKLANTYVERV